MSKSFILKDGQENINEKEKLISVEESKIVKRIRSVRDLLDDHKRILHQIEMLQDEADKITNTIEGIKTSGVVSINDADIPQKLKTTAKI